VKSPQRINEWISRRNRETTALWSIKNSDDHRIVVTDLRSGKKEIGAHDLDI